MQPGGGDYRGSTQLSFVWYYRRVFRTLYRITKDKNVNVILIIIVFRLDLDHFIRRYDLGQFIRRYAGYIILYFVATIRLERTSLHRTSSHGRTVLDHDALINFTETPSKGWRQYCIAIAIPFDRMEQFIRHRVAVRYHDYRAANLRR